jgi:mRNA-degrading endonuclease YafQ of YafQ-DinJ toxin-antitoxin module
MKVSFSTSFKKAFKKKIKGRTIIESIFWNTLDIFLKDPFHPTLKTHKLSGKLKFLWSYSIEYDLRVIFYFEDNNKKAIFTDIGTHDEVY